MVRSTKRSLICIGLALALGSALYVTEAFAQRGGGGFRGGGGGFRGGAVGGGFRGGAVGGFRGAAVGGGFRGGAVGFRGAGVGVRGPGVGFRGPGVAGWRGAAWRGAGWRGAGWRYGRYWPGVATGVGIGLAAGWPYYGDYGYYDGYYDGYDGYDAGPYYGVPTVGYGDGSAYCAQRFRSYDPATGTYLGYDGLRHPCP